MKIELREIEPRVFHLYGISTDNEIRLKSRVVGIEEIKFNMFPYGPVVFETSFNYEYKLFPSDIIFMNGKTFHIERWSRDDVVSIVYAISEYYVGSRNIRIGYEKEINKVDGMLFVPFFVYGGGHTLGYNIPFGHLVYYVPSAYDDNENLIIEKALKRISKTLVKKCLPKDYFTNGIPNDADKVEVASKILENFQTIKRFHFL